MDFLKGQLDKIQQQLGGLNASQKMLTGSLVAIMVMTLLWWGRYAGTAEMEPVLPQSLSPGDITKVMGHLEAMKIPTKLAGDRVLIPADRRFEAIASLAMAEVMPDNFVSGFDEISKQMNPLMPQATTEALFKEGKQKTLQNVLRRFPGVKDAVVLIEPPTGRRIGTSGNEASASVHIMMKDGGAGNRKLADAAASLVAGAQQHLSVGKVTVIIGHRRYHIRGDDGAGGMGDELGELVAAHEQRYEQKIQDLYHFIEGLVVKVSVNVNTTTTQTQNKTTDANVIQKELETETRNDSEPAASEPRALPNTGASIDQLQVATAVGEKTHEETRTKYENFPSTKLETSSSPAGGYNVVSATVRVPRSYFVKMYKTANNSTAEPTSAAALQEIVNAEADRIRQDVIGCTAITDQSRVMVSMYDDAAMQQPSMATVAPASSLTASISSYGKEIAIGALAVISLFMVSTMVRKGTPAPIIAAAAAGPRETPVLDGNGELVGVVGDSNPMLHGMELDEDAVRTQQMLDQVSTMVGQNPDGAATVVKRWLNRT